MTGKSGGQFSQKTLLHEHDRVPVDAIRDDDDVPHVGRERQRIDRWLWHARLVRTRSAAGSARELWPCARKWRTHPRARPYGTQRRCDYGCA